MVMRLTVRPLLDALGGSPFRVLTAPDGDFAYFTGVRIYDPREELTWGHRDVLLAVGIVPSSAEAQEMIRRAPQPKTGCVVIKSYGEPVTDLVMAAESAEIMLVEAEERLTWHDIEVLLTSLHTVVSSRQWGIDMS